MTSSELIGWCCTVGFLGACIATYLDTVLAKRRREKADREWLERVTEMYREETSDLRRYRDIARRGRVNDEEAA